MSHELSQGIRLGAPHGLKTGKGMAKSVGNYRFNSTRLCQAAESVSQGISGVGGAIFVEEY